jgi:hypothetical protein
LTIGPLGIEIESGHRSGTAMQYPGLAPRSVGEPQVRWGTLQCFSVVPPALQSESVEHGNVHVLKSPGCAATSP